MCLLQMGSIMSQLDLGDNDKAAVFQGGNHTDLHRMLGIRSGTQVLYVGDHIYGDILRSKKVRDVGMESRSSFFAACLAVAVFVITTVYALLLICQRRLSPHLLHNLQGRMVTMLVANFHAFTQLALQVFCC